MKLQLLVLLLVSGLAATFALAQVDSPAGKSKVSAATDSAAPKPKLAQFRSEIEPILKKSCLGCHGAKKQEGEFRIDLKEEAFRGGEDYAPGVDPGKPDDSAVFWMTELDDDGLCCGAGGAYSVFHPEISGDVRARKVDAIDQVSPDLVASANPGCSMHLAAAGVETAHPMELIDRALRGEG